MAIHKPHARETTLRHLWLAGLGLVSLLRRDALARRAVLPPIARGRIRKATRLLDEGIGPRLAPLVRALALRPKATAAVERGGDAEVRGSGAPARPSTRLRRKAPLPGAAPTARPRQSR